MRDNECIHYGVYVCVCGEGGINRKNPILNLPLEVSDIFFPNFSIEFLKYQSDFIAFTLSQSVSS